MNNVKYYTITSYLGAFLLLILGDSAQLFAQNNLSIYGYFATRFERSFNIPERRVTETIKETAPGEWSYPSLNMMFQQQISDKYRIYINLNGADACGMDVRNFWGEYSHSNYFNLRVGKIYRKFGLYNEILDAVPTYYGIEPPELFDKDHLIVSRTTTFMIFGNIPIGNGILYYSASTDNGEGDIFSDTFPFGGDINYKFLGGNYTLGVSGYTSGGKTTSDVSVGDGSPRSGVLPWMEYDKFTVFDVYGEGMFGDLTIQVEYITSTHKAVRNVQDVINVVNNAGINSNQRSRFLKDPNLDAVPNNINTNGNYDVTTWYIRGGYSIETSLGEFGPYFQWDYYNNPETIASKSYGGDAESGEADNGVFNKATLGILFRPIPEVAVKLDGSSHMYKYYGEDVSYPEIRLDFSYTFGF